MFEEQHCMHSELTVLIFSVFYCGQLQDAAAVCRPDLITVCLTVYNQLKYQHEKCLLFMDLKDAVAVKSSALLLYHNSTSLRFVMNLV
jgi:hypothetical protein